MSTACVTPALPPGWAQAGPGQEGMPLWSGARPSPGLFPISGEGHPPQRPFLSTPTAGSRGAPGKGHLTPAHCRPGVHSALGRPKAGECSGRLSHTPETDGWTRSHSCSQHVLEDWLHQADGSLHPWCPTLQAAPGAGPRGLGGKPPPLETRVLTLVYAERLPADGPWCGAWGAPPAAPPPPHCTEPSRRPGPGISCIWAATLTSQGAHRGLSPPTAQTQVCTQAAGVAWTKPTKAAGPEQSPGGSTATGNPTVSEVLAPRARSPPTALVLGKTHNSARSQLPDGKCTQSSQSGLQQMCPSLSV